MSMKLCIIGAGAMGCLIGGHAQRGGHEVVYLARGRQLEALRQRGLTLKADTGASWHAPARAVATPQEAGAAEVVMLCTKSHQLPEASRLLAPLLAADTIIVPAVNGIPWWYFHRHGGPFDGRVLASLDPDGLLARNIPLERVVGCVNYLAGTITAPGEVHYVAPVARRLAIGEPDGSESPRLQALAALLADGGFDPIVSANIRQTIWHKLWGNIAFNPISALTHGTIDQIAEGYQDIDLVSAVMNEARFIADKLGIELGQTIKSRVDAAAKMRGHKTSMLQDIEHQRPTEIEAIVGVVREIAQWLDIDTPHLNGLYSLVKLKEHFYRQLSAAAGGDGQR